MIVSAVSRYCMCAQICSVFFFSSRRRHTRYWRDWSSDVCSSDLEGQTARDIFPEDDGIPEVAQDDSPTMQRAEDPEFMALPGESATATVDYGTTAFEQSQGESLKIGRAHV